VPRGGDRDRVLKGHVAPTDGSDVPIATLTLLPMRRLGALLRERRHADQRTIDEVADLSGMSSEEIGLVEAGQLALTDRQLDSVFLAYGTTAERLAAERAQVVIDVDRGEIVVADETASLGVDAPTPDEILAAYLSLLYTVRRTEPGSPLVLRSHDVGVLARSLALAEPDVRARLDGLMRRPSGDLGRYHTGLRRRWAVPLAGVVVVAGVIGTVLLVGDDRSGGRSPTTVTTRPGAIESPVSTGVSLVPPEVAER
jgi:transcriptional regulator with XRE-family HTH domain